MGTHVIPLRPSVPSYRLRTVLDQREYILELRWSMREERWYLDLRDTNGDLLVGPIKLVVGWPLLYRYRTVEGMPPGDLLVVDGRAAPADPTLDDLGASLQLVYIDGAGLAEAEAA